jgi:hypothetical protein
MVAYTIKMGIARGKNKVGKINSLIRLPEDNKETISPIANKFTMQG